MFLLKPTTNADLDELVQLAELMAPGITTFPPNKEVIASKIQRSIQAFSLPEDDIDTPREFLLALHDLTTGRIVGTTGIYSHIGIDVPFYSFKRLTENHSTILPDDQTSLSITSTALQLTSDTFTDGTEVGTLLLHPDYLGLRLGKLLAKCRYMMLNIFNNLFKEPVFAELRGWTEEGNVSPFWEALGRHFFADMPFAKADYLSATTDKQFIADLFPKYPIYEHLLPESARNCINMANAKGQAALNMLYKEGFSDQGYIDIFDAGATVVANFTDLKTYNNTTHYRLAEMTQKSSCEAMAMIATGDLTDFRVIQTRDYYIEHNTLYLDSETIHTLGPRLGDSVYVVIL